MNDNDPQEKMSSPFATGSLLHLLPAWYLQAFEFATLVFETPPRLITLLLKDPKWFFISWETKFKLLDLPSKTWSYVFLFHLFWFHL